MSRGATTSSRLMEGVEPAQSQGKYASSNLAYDPQAKIQTGPAEPEWNWNQVRCYWNGPVAADQHIHPIFVPLRLHRMLTVVRVILLLLLAAVVLGFRRLRNPFSKRSMPTAVVLICLAATDIASAQFPDAAMLDQLRERILRPSDAFPKAAEIPSVQLRVADGRLAMTAIVHAAVDVAVPLPGQLPAWSPVAVRVDDQSDALVCRQDGFLWVNLAAGVHTVVVEGLLPDSLEWEWTFLLPPRRSPDRCTGMDGDRRAAQWHPGVAGFFLASTTGNRGRGVLRSQGFQYHRGRRSPAGNRTHMAIAHRCRPTFGEQQSDFPGIAARA